MEGAWVEVAAIVLCVLLSAMFSGAETAITSYGELKAEHLLKRLGSQGHVLRLWINDPARVLTTILIGNNLVNVLASALATDLALRLFPDAGVVVAAVTMTIVVLIFGEVLPKVYARANSERLILMSLRFVHVLGWMLYPAVSVVARMASGWLRKSGVGGVKSTITEEELAFLVELGERQGTLEKEKKRLLENIFVFGGKIVREVMTPRMDMVTIPIESSGVEAVQVMLEMGHSRIPVHENRIDNIVGIVHAKDLLKKVHETGALSFAVRAVLRDPFLVPESKPLDELLLEMRKSKNQMAIVLDEFGGTAGLITFEDLIEEIVGDIRDEYDEQEEDPVQAIGKDRFLVYAGMNYADFEKGFGKYLIKATSADTEYDTVGGMIADRLGRIPVKGETLRIGELELSVVDAGKRRVRKVLVRVLKELNQTSSDEQLTKVS